MNKNYPALRSSENLKVMILSAKVGLKLRILRRFVELFSQAQIRVFVKLI